MTSNMQQQSFLIEKIYDRRFAESYVLDSFLRLWEVRFLRLDGARTIGSDDWTFVSLLVVHLDALSKLGALDQKFLMTCDKF